MWYHLNLGEVVKGWIIFTIFAVAVIFPMTHFLIS